jgi:phosphoribosylamine-glycine ligase
VKKEAIIIIYKYDPYVIDFFCRFNMPQLDSVTIKVTFDLSECQKQKVYDLISNVLNS